VSEHSFGPGYTVSSLSYVVSLLPKSIVRTLRLERPRRDGQAGPNLVRQILWHRIRDRAEATMPTGGRKEPPAAPFDVPLALPVDHEMRGRNTRPAVLRGRPRWPEREDRVTRDHATDGTNDVTRRAADAGSTLSSRRGRITEPGKQQASTGCALRAI
jgi:hypothetical protein